MQRKNKIKGNDNIEYGILKNEKLIFKISN